MKGKHFTSMLRSSNSYSTIQKSSFLRNEAKQRFRRKMRSKINFQTDELKVCIWGDVDEYKIELLSPCQNESVSILRSKTFSLYPWIILSHFFQTNCETSFFPIVADLIESTCLVGQLSSSSQTVSRQCYCPYLHA